MQEEDALAPMRLTWEPGLDSGHPTIDLQHRSLLDACNELAGLCSGSERPAHFDRALSELKARLRMHLEAEAQLLAAGDPAAHEDLLAEREDFEALAEEIATTEHFDRLELQPFLALWCQGHVRASARLLRAALAAGAVSINPTL